MSGFTEDRYTGYRLIYGAEGYERISTSKVLVVGAGGIGCELLKNMALVGFRNIDLIDLDTIDVSNLNRQFLFRPAHVGKPKAVVAAEAAKNFNKDCNVIAHYGNVKDTSKFGVNHIKKFDCVLNALDNIDARRHVNRLCLAANVPLIDSGTTGYNGQIAPIMKGISECYECKPKPVQKTYPICTIRSTPDKPVHCIVWAKEFFKLIFGNTEESMLYENVEGEEPSTYMNLVSIANLGGDRAKLLEQGAQLLEAVFCTEIKKRIAMDTYKTAKVPPSITAAADLAEGREMVLRGDTKPKLGDRAIWSDAECVAELLACYIELATTRPGEVGKLTFEKDDDTIMRLVTAAANMRCRIFSIPAQCLYDAKGIAGNIIPAIATTNAIAAAEQVSQACRVLASTDRLNAMSNLRKTWIFPSPISRLRQCLQPERSICEPSATCFVCSRSVVNITIDTSKRTLQDLVTDVLKKKLGFLYPNVGLAGGIEIYEEGEGCDEDTWEHLPKPLDALPGGGIKDGTTVCINDMEQDLEVEIVVTHMDEGALQEALEVKTKEKTDAFFAVGTDLKDVVSSSSSSDKVSASTGGTDRKSTENDAHNGGSNHKRQRTEDVELL
jgi:ubiquitin-like 1-activating enzyme E1 B